MTAIRWDSSIISDMSWVMNRTEKPELALQLGDLRHDLLLHDDVERGRRLVHDQQVGPQGDRHGDDHALAHAAGELVRVGLQPGRVDAHELEQLGRPRPRACFFDSPSWVVKMSTIWSPTVMTGLREFMADWKTIATSRHRKRAQLVGVQGEDVSSLEPDRTRR